MVNLIVVKQAIELIPSIVSAVEEVLDWWNDETPSQPVNYFTPDEINCQCQCGMTMKPEALAMFNGARHIAGIPFHCISGARCRAHNKAVGGSEESTHTDGVAMDLRITSSEQRATTMIACQAMGMKRFGIGKGKFHADCSIIKPTPRIWEY